MTEAGSAVSWYDVDFDEDNLSQGEILFNCSVLALIATLNDFREEQSELSAEEILGNFVILSQSCDLEQGNIDTVILVPVYSVGAFVAEEPNLCQKALQCAESKQIPIPGREPRNEAFFLQLALECRSVRSEIDKIRKGDKPAYHLLNEDSAVNFPFSVVDFHRIYSAPKNYL